MKKRNMFTYSFKTPGCNYIYDVNTNKILPVNDGIYNAVLNESFDSLSDEDARTIEKLKGRGLFSNNRIKEIKHPASDSVEYYLKSKIEMLTLQVTQNCNLRCGYCAYSGNYTNRTHNNRNMSLETAKKSIDFYIDHSRDSETISVGFYGGEPLIELALIKECIDYTYEKAAGKKKHFTLTTNGTLLTDEIIEYFIEHDLALIISLDGPKEIHDTNRTFAGTGCGSFDKVMTNLENIKSKYPDYFNKILYMTVLNQNNDFSCINTFVTNYDTIKDQDFMFSDVSSDYLMTDTYTPKEAFNKKSQYEVFKMFLNELGEIKRDVTSPLVRDYFNRLQDDFHRNRTPRQKLPDEFHHSGPCIPGVMRLFITVDGTLYPCERVSETSEIMKIGHIDTGFDSAKVQQLLNIGQVSAESCKDCWAINFCSICAASLDNNTHLCAEKKKARCEIVKLDIHDSLIEYCILKEFGFDFDQSLKFNTQENSYE